MNAASKERMQAGAYPRIPRRGARAGALLRVGLTTLAILLVSASSALAHVRLVRSAPAAGERITVAPDTLHLWFSDSPELSVTRFILVGPDGTEIPLGSVTASTEDGRALTARVLARLAPGEYTVTWLTAAPDGHPLRGSYRFQLEPPPAEAQSDTLTAGGPRAGDDTMLPAPVQLPLSGPAAGAELSGGEQLPPISISTATVRWIGFVALFTMVGAVVFRLFVLPGARRDEWGPDLYSGASAGAARLGTAASLALGAVALARLYLQLFALQEQTTGFEGSVLGGVVAGTAWGRGWLVEITASLAAALGFALARPGRAAGWWVAAAAALVAAATPALTGHAASAATPFALSVTLDALHVIGASAWLGTLALVALVGIPAALRLQPGARGAAVSSLVLAFSPVALLGAAVAVVTGVVTAWLRLGAVAALWETDYGRALLVKLAMLVLVLLAGAFNWKRVGPSLGRDEAVPRIRRSSAVELTFAALLLAATAALIALPPPAMTAAAEEPARAGAGEP